MSHSALVNAGLFYVVVVQPLLLVIFVWAVSRAPSGPPDTPSHPEPESPAPQVSAPQPSQLLEPAGLPVMAPWPSAEPVGSPGETDYVGRHATRGGPPWGPAPRPPGAAW